MATRMSRGGGRGGIRPSIRIVPKLPTGRKALLNSTAFRGGALAWLGLAVAPATPRRRWFSRAGAMVALAGGFLAIPAGSALAACTNPSTGAWLCKSSGATSGNGPQTTVVVPNTLTGPFTVDIGQSGGNDDNYESTSAYSAAKAGALIISNAGESGTITETAGSKLTGDEADGLRYFNSSSSTNSSVTFNLYGTLYGGNNAARSGSPSTGDGMHVGTPAIHAPDVEPSMGTLTINLGSESDTSAVIRGGDDGLYIGTEITNQVTFTNYGTVQGKGMSPNPDNSGEGVHISRVDQGSGSGYQIQGAATVENYGRIVAHANTGNGSAGPGTAVNISAEGDILVGNAVNPGYVGSGLITGTSGVVAYGGGSNTITVSNAGHIEGTAGDGIQISHGGVGSITNHSFHSVIGSGGVNSDGVDAEDFRQVTFDNEGGLTAGITGTGATIATVSGIGESGDAVHVNNTNGGLIAGYTGGLVIQNVTGNSTESEANNIYVDNHAAWTGDGYTPGGLIVGAGDGANGIDISHVYASSVGGGSALDSGSVTIDNRNTSQTSIDLGAITDASVYAVGEGDEPTGLLARQATRFPPADAMMTGIYGDNDAVSLTGIGGGVTIYNEDGWIYGWNGGGVVMSEIGGNIDIFNNSTSGENIDSLITGNQVGVGIDGFWGNVDIENGGGRIGGSYVGVHVANSESTGQHVTVANTTGIIGGQYDAGVDIDANATVTVTNGESGVGTITGTTGVLVQGGDGYAISVSNSGHIEGTDGSGIQISHGTVGSITNHSFNSVIGSGGSDTSGVDAENFRQVTFDNRGGLTAGIDGTGSTIAAISGIGESGDAVHVDNTEAGVIAGYTAGLVIHDVTGNTTESEANNVIIDNHAQWINNGFTSGGLIVGAEGDGISVSHVFASSVGSESAFDSGSVTIDNRDTQQTQIHLGDITDSSVYAVGEGDVRSGLLAGFGDAHTGPNQVSSGGIFGFGGSGVTLSDIGGGATIYNEDGTIEGRAGDGVAISNIGGTVSIFNGVSSEVDSAGYITGTETGVGVSGFWGNVDVENGIGSIEGVAGRGVYIAGANGSGQQVTVANGGNIASTAEAGVEVAANAAILVTNDASVGIGSITGGTVGVLAQGNDQYGITVNNSGHIEGFDGSGIAISHGTVGSITNHSFHSVIGSGGSAGVDAENFAQVVFDNQGGLTAGLSGNGATIAEISGIGESGDAVAVYNSEGGLLAGTTGLSIHDVTGNSAESEANNVYIDNSATYDHGTHSFVPGGLIVGTDGTGISITNVYSGESFDTSGSVTIDNQNTRHTSIDFGTITDSAVYSEGDPSTGLLGAFADSQSDGSESVSTGIFGSRAIYVSEVGGGFTLNNEDGLVVGTDGDGVHIDSIGGDVAINNGRSWRHGDGGLIVGSYGADAIDVENFYKNVTVDNAHGTIQGSNNGVTIVDALGTGQFITVHNESGSITADGVSGVGVNVSVNDTSAVAIDNSRAGHHGDGGVISGGLYGAAVTGGAVVDVDNTGGTIYASESGSGAGLALTDVGRVAVTNAGGEIYDTFANSDGINMVGVGEGADIDNAASWHEGGGYIGGTEHGIFGFEIEHGVTVENAAGLIAGLNGEGIHLGSVSSSNEAGYAVGIDNSSTTWHDGGIIAGETNGIDINGVGGVYSAGNNIVGIDNSGSESGAHVGGLIAGATGDGIEVYNAESDVQIFNDYTRANGSLDIGGTGVAGIASLSEAGGDFLSSASTGIWGIEGAGINGANIAGSVYVSNQQGQIVGLADDMAAIQLNGVGSGLNPASHGTAVEIDNSSLNLAGESDAIVGDFSRYALLSGGDYGVLLQNVQNGDVVFHNDLGITYGDEMAFALNGLTEGDVLVTNMLGVMEGHNGSSGVFPTRDSYGAVTIANVDGHVEIDNSANNQLGYGGDIIGVDSASAIYLAGGIKSATVYNGGIYQSESDGRTHGGLIVGSGTEANAVIVMNTSTGESDTPAAANGVILNNGLIASTNLLGFSDPDVTGESSDVTAVTGAMITTANFLGGGVLPSWASEGEAFQNALAAIDNRNSGADGVSAARDLAVQSQTGAVWIDNQAAIIGRVDLTGSNAGESGEVGNAFTNTGVWYTEGANYLGAGSTIQNDGIIQTAFGSEGDLNTSFDVADFNNDSPAVVGYLSMLDGVVGNTVTITGNFHGANAGSESGYSYVALDAYLDASASEGGSPAADVLHIEGNVTGTTGLIINNINPNAIEAANLDGIKVVQVDGVSESCAAIACKDGDPFFISSKSTGYFAINGIGTIEQGLYAWYLTDPTESGHEYDLVSAALPTADQAPELISAFANIFYNGITDVVSDHIYGGTFDPKDASAGADVSVDGAPDRTPNGAMWGRISGAWSRQDTTVDTGLGPVDTGYNQNTYTMLGGLDMSPSGDGTGLRLGAYGGYVSSNADFDSYAATGKYRGGVAGGYVAYSKDDFYVDTQFSADFVNLSFNAPLGTGVTGNVNGTTYGLLADAGKRFYEGSTFIEPIASFAYANTTLGEMQSGTATLSFSNGESVRGGLGARIGMATTDSSGVHVEMSLLGRIWDEFSGNNQVTVTDGVNTDTFVDDTAGVFGEISASATLVSPDRSTSIFASGGATFKPDATTLNAKAGVRKSF